MASESSKRVDEKKKKTKLEGDDEDYDYLTIPPDGGYGWVVLVACFVSRDRALIACTTSARSLSR